MYSSAESDIDTYNVEDSKNTSMPMAEKTQFNVLRRAFKPKNIVSDYKSKKEKVDYYIEKCLHIKNKEKKNEYSGYTETCTPNKYCYFGISTFGLNQEIIDFLETHNSLISLFNENKKKLSKETIVQIRKFKEEFIALFPNKHLRELIEKNTFYLCSKNLKNILVVKNLPKKYSYFNKQIFIHHNNKESNVDQQEEILDKENERNIKEYLKDEINLDEFMNSIKNGFDLATSKL